MKRSNIAVSFCVLAASLVISGCGSDSDDPPESRVRILNASLANNAGQPVDILLNGQRLFTNVGFGATSARIEVPAGTAVPFTIQQAGTGVNVGTGNVNITHSVDQTLLVTGVPNGTGGLQYQLLALPPEDLSNTPTSTQSRVYFVNAGTNTTAAGSVASFTYTLFGGGPTTVSGVNFGEMSAAQLPASGDYTFSATVGGQTVTTTATLQGGKSYTVVLSGRTTTAGGTPGLALTVIPNNP
jgi:hypothetical protein